VTVNFFPLGYTEKAVIELSDGEGDTYAVVVHAFTGKIEIRQGRFDAEDFMHYRADGEQQDERGER
jgi:hypothetical protein